MSAQSIDIWDFVAIGEAADTTKQIIAMNLRRAGRGERSSSRGTEEVERVVLEQARKYLSNVREGFVLSVRTGQVVDKQELSYLLDRVLLDWDAFYRSLGLEAEVQEESGYQREVARVKGQLLAFGTAVVALGALPRLPAEEITFPHSYGKPPTYADIPVPVTPGEILSRIEEIEQMLWQFALHRWDELLRRQYGPLRRTYGFFESSALLVRRESERFGVKKPRDIS
ncbi:MAG: hypothetical protein D6775_14710 [Caldilineae bacterium]|nr:MAG: hypothetical protein D6775_14710 [Caldilineae bacterium]